MEMLQVETLSPILASQKEGTCPEIVHQADLELAHDILVACSDVRMKKTAAVGDSEGELAFGALAKAFQTMNIKAEINFGDLLKGLMGAMKETMEVEHERAAVPVVNPKTVVKAEDETPKKAEAETENTPRSLAMEREAQTREMTVKIPSKTVRESHYQADVSRDRVYKDGQELYMVSVYLRESYLGRYLVKRNFFFTPAHAQRAERTYEDLVRGIMKIKRSYLDDQIGLVAVRTCIGNLLEDVQPDLHLTEDQIGTTVKRKQGK